MAIGPLRWTVRLVPATVCLTIAATRLNAACVSGDAASPANVMGRFKPCCPCWPTAPSFRGRRENPEPIFCPACPPAGFRSVFGRRPRRRVPARSRWSRGPKGGRRSQFFSWKAALISFCRTIDGAPGGRGACSRFAACACSVGSNSVSAAATAIQHPMTISGHRTTKLPIRSNSPRLWPRHALPPDNRTSLAIGGVGK